MRFGRDRARSNFPFPAISSMPPNCSFLIPAQARNLLCKLHSRPLYKASWMRLNESIRPSWPVLLDREPSRQCCEAALMMGK